MAKTLRVGMVGDGFMGRAHSNAWRQAPYFFPLKAKVELHTICGRSAAEVQTARAQLGWQFAATDWREVVESPLIEIVDIVASNDSHAEIAQAAARAGKHVLCEKPIAITAKEAALLRKAPKGITIAEAFMALNVKQAAAMLAAVQKAKVGHMVCHNYRWAPAIAQAKKLIAEGALGQIYHYHARYAQDWVADAEAATRLKPESDDSGAPSQLGVQLIDLGRHLVGEFKEVCGLMDALIKERPPAGQSGTAEPPVAKGKVKRPKPSVDDAGLFIGRFENGAMANLEVTGCAPGRKNQVSIEINGSKGSLCFDFEEMNRLQFYNCSDPPDRQGFRDILVTQPGGIQPYAGQWWGAGRGLGYEHTYVHAVADFVNACVDRKPVSPGFEDGLKNQRVLESVEESVKTRRWVKV
jgi:predicted dehydrogenase